MKKLAVLVSGSGTNLQSIIDSIKCGELKDTKVEIVISNKKEAYALKRAELEGIKNLFLNPKEFNSSLEYDKELVEVLKEHNIDLIVLAGYLKILTEYFVNAFLNKIINIHPALLPSFGGKGMYGEKVHKAVLESKVKETGCTVHFVTSEVDGGPIITQRKVGVLEGDTISSLAKRVLEKEHELLIEAIKKII